MRSAGRRILVLAVVVLVVAAGGFGVRAALRARAEAAAVAALGLAVCSPELGPLLDKLGEPPKPGEAIGFDVLQQVEPLKREHGHAVGRMVLEDWDGARARIAAAALQDCPPTFRSADQAADRAGRIMMAAWGSVRE